MRCELSSVIKDIAAGPFGSNLKVECFIEKGFPIIDGANLKGIKVTDNVTKFVTEEKARSLHRSIAHRMDVIVTISGNVGQISYIPDDSAYEEYLVSQRQFRVTFDEEKVYVPYLVYYFHTYEGQNQILSFANQTGVPALSQPLKNFKKIVVDLPIIDEQKKIASVLKSLDDKIALNQRINENLEEQARAVFQSWFVDFEPWGGEMPEDWKETTLSEIADFVPGYSYKGSELKDSCTAMATIKNFERGGGFKLDGFKEIEPSDKIKESHYAEQFDILVAHTDLTQKAEVIGNAEIILDTAGYHKIIFSMDLVKVVPKNNFSKYLLAQVLKDQIFKSHCLGYVNGTTVLHLSKKALPEYTLMLPQNINELQALSDVIEALYRKQSEVMIENRKLSALRDFLLPKLMNGVIEV